MKKSRQQGFTIAELLIVIAIMGILTTLVIVNLQRGERSDELRQVGIELLQHLRLAQGYSVGGNSISFCDESSPENERYLQCTEGDDAPCNGGTCITSVPAGGYGLSIASTDNYWLFGDKKPNKYFDNEIYDYGISYIDLAYKGIHIKEFKLGSEPAVIPSSTLNRLDITFEPPLGTIHFYLDLEAAKDSQDQLYSTLELLVSSDYVSNNCRKITVNRISGQISESQSSCSL